MKDKDRKSIAISYDGVDYTLMYTVASIRKMERDGFDFTNMDKNIVNVGFDLFSGAFIAKHNYVPEKLRDEIYLSLKPINENGQNLLEVLADMLKDELEFIVNKPQGNVNWAMV